MAKTKPTKSESAGARHDDRGDHGDDRHHRRYKVCKDRDTVNFHLGHACEPGRHFDHAIAMPYDGSYRKFAWCIGNLPCAGQAAVHIYVDGEDRGQLFVITPDTPKYGCDRTCVDFECGDSVKLVIKAVVDQPFCSVCDVNVTLTNVKRCKIPKRKKVKCPELAEWYDQDADVNVQEVPVFPASIVVELEAERALPPHPHISYDGAGVYRLKHGVYKMDVKMGAISPQSTDVVLTYQMEKSDDNGATWVVYEAAGAAQRFLTGVAGGWMTLASPNPTLYVPNGTECLIRHKLWRTADSTEVNTLKNASAFTVTRLCGCPHYCDPYDDDDGDDGDDGME